MKILLTLLFVNFTLISLAQVDSTKKASLICMLNAGALYPEHGYSENKSDYSGYSNFEVAPKLGYNTNISVGLSYALSRNFDIESLFGVGRSSSNYTKTGISFSKYGIVGPDSFRGIINENRIEQYLVLLNGITFSNPQKIKNKIYFSNYISISMIFSKLLKREVIDFTKNSKGTGELLTRHTESAINTSHILSYGFHLKKTVLKTGVGINIYFFNYNRGYINPFINLTLKI